MTECWCADTLMVLSRRSVVTKNKTKKVDPVTSIIPEDCLKITDNLIPWSFVFQVKKHCNGDWDAVMDVFWKARHAKGKNAVQRYIRAGLKPNQCGVKYALLPSKEREDGRMDSIRQWFDSLYKRKRAPNQEAFDIVSMLAGKFDCAETKSRS
jgi:hypothetical protein